MTGVIGTAEVDALNHFTYPEPLEPGAEPNRTEVDIARQTLTLYQDGQPRLLTTASSGSGEQYCYDQPLVNPTEHICEVANTPSGRFTYYLRRSGWDVGVLGGLYNPFYFNGGIAVHGALSVPATPASHGCVRIPMHIAEYFSSIVHNGDAVYVVGGSPLQVLSRESLTPRPRRAHRPRQSLRQHRALPPAPDPRGRRRTRRREAGSVRSLDLHARELGGTRVIRRARFGAHARTRGGVDHDGLAAHPAVGHRA